MKLQINKWLAALILAALLWPAPGAAQADQKPGPRQVRMQALEQMIGASGGESLERFIDEQIDPEYVRRMTRPDLVAFLQRIRKLCARAGGITAEPAGEEEAVLNFETERAVYSVRFTIAQAPPHRIVQLSITEGEAPAPAAVKELSWDRLDSQLEEAAAAGFSGTVLVVRDGEIVLHRGYGLAERERGIPNSTGTVYAIGSTPIDFTKAAILKLADQDRLELSDSITKFFTDVPADKQAITLEQLMQGRSGLPNFHHIPGRDEDYDLTWINRQEAVRRILGKELLFPPGQGEAHSHSAWTLLAAVVEIVSGQSYEELLRRYFFEPLGMNSTGLYPLARTLDPDLVAVGYGGMQVGTVNSPAYWGNTSWLVMGSGGMVSNPADLFKWVRGIRSGGILSAAAQRRYWTEGVLAGDNDRGFFCLYTQGERTFIILCSNVFDPPAESARRLGLRLARLVRSD